MRTDAEIETERLKDIQEDRGDAEEDRLAEAAPGTFYAHEALHMCAFLQNSVYTELLHHPTVMRDPVLYRLAYQAHATMYALYQRISAEHFEAENPAHVVQ